MCITTQELLNEIEKIDRKEQYFEQNYATFDVAFYALAIAGIAIMVKTVDIAPILFRCFEIVAEKFM